MGEFYSLVLEGNNGLFPLVVGVVENESKESGGVTCTPLLVMVPKKSHGL